MFNVYQKDTFIMSVNAADPLEAIKLASKEKGIKASKLHAVSLPWDEAAKERTAAIQAHYSSPEWSNYIENNPFSSFTKTLLSLQENCTHDYNHTANGTLKICRMCGKEVFI